MQRHAQAVIAQSLAPRSSGWWGAARWLSAASEWADPYIVNPPSSAARIDQHLDIGQGEVGWELFFGTLEELRFDGIMTACVFAWEQRARESSRYMLAEMMRYTGGWQHLASPTAAAVS